MAAKSFRDFYAIKKLPPLSKKEGAEMKVITPSKVQVRVRVRLAGDH
jgi:hypothetical protein